MTKGAGASTGQARRPSHPSRRAFLAGAGSVVGAVAALPAEDRNRRSRPRTVSSGTPDAAAIDRNPCPRAARASMSPITAVPSHRRASSHAGRRTCVAPHEEHRARRGRTATGSLPAVNTRRRTA